MAVLDLQLVLVLLTSLGVAGYHFYYAKRLQKCEPLGLVNFIVLTLAVAASISALKLIILACTSKALGEILSTDDTVVLFLGAVCVIWISCSEIFKLFERQP